MNYKHLLDRLPEPTKPEEMMIYNFLKGKEVYPVSALTTKDMYLQALLCYLSEQIAAAKKPPVVKHSKTTSTNKE